jgi:hypothetical protein
MLKDLSRARLAGAWCAALIVVGALGVVVFGAEVTVSNIELWLVACVVPSVVMLLAWRGAPARTVAEVLYAVDSPSKEARP